MRSVTIDDVAKAAGVSIKTVSRVVNREPNVRAATKEKVENAIRELDYRPNQSARGLASRRSYMIGLVYDSPSPNYLANLQAGMLEACRANHYGLSLNPVSFHADDMVEQVVHWARQAFLDGIVITPPLSDSVELLEKLREKDIPCVIMSSKSRGGTPAVLIDEEEAAYQMTRHLIEMGHRHIAFIKGHPDHYSSSCREHGFRKAMAEAGLDLPEGYVQQGYYDFASGRDAASELLSMPTPPTAIFASNDDMAAAVIYEAHSRKIDVPSDLAVAGFDDTPLSRQIWPGMTTVRQPIRSMGRHASQALIDAMTAEGRERLDSAGEMHIDFELKLRASTAKA